MGVVTRYPNGTFCWIELETPNLAEAQTFYEQLFGWAFDQTSSGDGSAFSMGRLQGEPVAGIRESGETARWRSLIWVDDVEAAARRAEDLHGSIVMPPTDLPSSSRVAVIVDPMGADLTLWHSDTFSGARWVNEVGTWAWNELVTANLDDTTTFYTELFDWTPMEAPPLDIIAGGRRGLFRRGELLIAGAHQPDQSQAPAWTVRFRVADAEATAQRVEELGGHVLLPPTPVPLGAYGEAADSMGAHFTFIAAPAGGVQGLDTVGVE